MKKKQKSKYYLSSAAGMGGAGRGEGGEKQCILRRRALKLLSVSSWKMASPKSTGAIPSAQFVH